MEFDKRFYRQWMEYTNISQKSSSGSEFICYGVNNQSVNVEVKVFLFDIYYAVKCLTSMYFIIL